MSELDEIIAGSFSSAGVSAPVSVALGRRLVYTLSGTWAGRVTLQRSRSLLCWDVAATMTANGTVTIDGDGGYYRFACSSYTSGTIVYSLRQIDQTVYLTDSNWDDLRFPAAGINPPGAAADATRDTEDGCLTFSATLTNTIAIQALMPHDWDDCTPVVPHIHWTKTTAASGNVVWEFKYKIADAGEAFPADWTTLMASSPVPGTTDTNTADKHLITSFGPVPVLCGIVAPMIKILVSRRGGDAADTYGAVAKMLEFDIHYLRDSVGSGGEFTK